MLNKKLLFLIINLNLFFISNSFAGNDTPISGGKQSAMGSVSVCFRDLWSANNNQAGMADLKKYETGLYVENRFLDKNLSYSNFIFAIPTYTGVLALNYSYFGFSLYNEQKVGLAYGKRLAKYLSVGLQLDYLRTFIGYDYGVKNNFTFELGLQSEVTERLTFGAYVFNPVNVKLNNYNSERIPVLFRTGLSYKASDEFLIACELEKNIYFKPSVKIGLEYRLVEKAYVRCGIKTQPIEYAFGAGFEGEHWVLDISSSIHQVLGYSPQLSAVYKF